MSWKIEIISDNWFFAVWLHKFETESFHDGYKIVLFLRENVCSQCTFPAAMTGVLPCIDIHINV